MKVLDLFSKRQARQRGEVPDVFVYGVLPEQLRVQIVHIFRDYRGSAEEIESYGLMVASADEFIVNS